ncbi:unnamed protein product [Cylicocyclus nassatus]|uniref:Protein SPEC3 n=1 Tax=Cylicocyclus nassatus TaxID=53992 RepID=A0AA36DMA7_CYLNA|nr:unnamed protein product [Cylicocyclus nassatus]
MTEHEDIRGWKVVQKNLTRIVEYGRISGILPPLSKPGEEDDQAKGAEDETAENQTQKEGKVVDKIIIPPQDITIMHQAIPFLPLPVALFCSFLNLIIPGAGTILSGITALCLGQPRLNMEEGERLYTMVLNLLVGVSQFFTITFFFVGWFWSIAWGFQLIIHAMHYRDAIQQRRQEAVATAAIEALAKDSIFHRKDVQNLMNTHKQNSSDKKVENKA